MPKHKTKKRLSAKKQQNAMRRNYKDTVFHRLFSTQPYTLRLTQESLLHDPSISLEDIKIGRVPKSPDKMAEKSV